MSRWRRQQRKRAGRRAYLDWAFAQVSAEIEKSLAEFLRADLVTQPLDAQEFKERIAKDLEAFLGTPEFQTSSVLSEDGKSITVTARVRPLSREHAEQLLAAGAKWA